MQSIPDVRNRLRGIDVSLKPPKKIVTVNVQTVTVTWYFVRNIAHETVKLVNVFK